MSTRWTFFSHHAHVLLCIARDPETAPARGRRARSGSRSGPCRRSSTTSWHEGYVTRERVGRRNHYEIHPEAPMRHPMHHDIDVGTLVGLLEHEQSSAR